MKFLSTVLSVLLTPLVAILPLQAEMASIPGTTTPSIQANALQIRLAEVGKATVEANSSVKGYAILVTDGSGLPVADVAVAIRLPEDGATGFFTDGAHSAVAYTDATGLATFTQVNWGSTLGTVSIRVTAAKGELHAGALVEQTIVSPSGAAPQVHAPSVAITPPAVAAATRVTALPAPKTSQTVPGTPTSVASVHSGATPEQTPARTIETAASEAPSVSIVTTAGSKGSRGNNKKWILLAVVAAGAGAGIAVALAGKGGAAAATAITSGLGIGTPTISVGH